MDSSLEIKKPNKKGRVKKKKIIKMSAYKITPKIITAYCLAGVSSVSFVGMCVYSAIMKGNAGIIVGIVPLLLAVCNMAGLALAYSEINNDDVRSKNILLGSALNGLLVILYMIIYIYGITMQVNK